MAFGPKSNRAPPASNHRIETVSPSIFLTRNPLLLTIRTLTHHYHLSPTKLQPSYLIAPLGFIRQRSSGEIMNKNWNDRADKDLFFTILSVKNIGVISGAEWTTIGNHMRSLGYGFTNEGCR